MDTAIESLEVRNYGSLKWKALIALILFIGAVISVLIQIFSMDFWIHFAPKNMYYFLAFAVSAYGIFYFSRLLYYNKGIQLRIDKDGIWTAKYKTWYWKDIWYFSTSTETVGAGRINILEIKLRDGVDDEHNSLLLPLDNYDKSKEEIRSIIEKYAYQNGIQDLGESVND